jgi:hypothetical protein
MLRFACVTEFLSTRKHTEAAAIHAVSLALAKRIVSSALSPLPHYIGRESYYWEVCHHFRMLSQKANAINQPIYNITSRRGTGKVPQPYSPTSPPHTRTHSFGWPGDRLPTYQQLAREAQTITCTVCVGWRWRLRFLGGQALFYLHHACWQVELASHCPHGGRRADIAGSATVRAYG